MRPPYARLALFISLFVTVTSNQLWPSAFETWKANDQAAAAASKVAHFAEAEKLLLTNEKLAETFPQKDARLPRTIFDLAQVYRAEGKHSDALLLYERAMQTYSNLYGPESPELRQTLLAADSGQVGQSKNDLGELYAGTGAFDKAEPLLLEALTIRRKAGETAEVAQSLQALGTLYGRTGRAQQAEQAFREAVSVFGKTVGGEHPDYANALENLALLPVSSRLCDCRAATKPSPRNSYGRVRSRIPRCGHQPRYPRGAEEGGA